MRRREFIAGLMFAAAMGRAQAQQRGRVYRLAVVDLFNPVTELTQAGELPWFRGFFEKLQQQGFAEGRNLQITRYSSEGHQERFGDIAREVINLQPDAAFVTSTRMLFTFKAAIQTIPLVGLMGDPVHFGLVASLARPGGNITGVSSDPGIDFYTKSFELLKEAIPKASKVGNLVSPAFAKPGDPFPAAARRLGIELILPVEAPYWREEEYLAAFKRMVAEGVDAILVSSMLENWTYRRLIVALAKEFRLPAIYPAPIFVQLGGLMSFGADFVDLGRECARIVVEIFKGANPANTPITQPTKYELSINLKTAKALGIELPPLLVARADNVIE